MAYSPISAVPIQYSKTDGTPANGYYLKFYVANSDTPISMQTDSGGATSLAKCKLNESGYPISNPNDENTVFIPHLNTTYTAYRFVLYASAADADANNVTSGLPNIQSVAINQSDDLRADLAASSGASIVGFIQSGAGAVATTVQDAIREFISVKRFGATGNGTNDDSTAIKNAIDHIIAAGGGILFFPAGVYKCAARIGTFLNASNVTLFGYGAEIKNCAGANSGGLIEFGSAAVDSYGMYISSTFTVFNLKMLGIKFTSSGQYDLGTLRWIDQLPISLNCAKDVLIKDCEFNDWDFAAINFGAICKNALVDACTFYSSRVEAGHANYGVRAFCYANYTNYANGNGDLSPTDLTTGVLKSGYSYISELDNTWGHENINVTNCKFEYVSHGVMLSAARQGIVANNRFINMSTRSISLTTYSADYLCENNTHTLDTSDQTSTGVSTFYGIGQGTFRHEIFGDKFTIFGATNNAAGFAPIKCYANAHDWIISECRFDIPLWDGGGGGRCIDIRSNVDGSFLRNHIKAPNVNHPVSISPTSDFTAPTFEQGKIFINGNIFEEYSTGAIQIFDTTANPEMVVIKDNIAYGSTTRFVACNASTSTSVSKLFLSGNIFYGGPIRYVDNITANKAKILQKDILELKTRLDTGGGVGNPSTTSVTFDFSEYNIPSCFSNGKKMYTFTTYGGRENAQLSTDFYFLITSTTATSITGDIIRNAGSSLQYGYVAMTVTFNPYIT